MCPFLQKLFRKNKYHIIFANANNSGTLHLESPAILEELENATKIEILLTQYREIVATLRNQDTIIFQMLSVFGTVIAAIITLSQQQNRSIPWGIIFSLILTWLFIYLYQIYLAEIRINILIEIENELKMKNHYQVMKNAKRAKSYTIRLILPLFGAFILGPLFGIIISNFNLIIQYFSKIWLNVTSKF